MALMSFEFNELKDLFIHELKDLYDAEHRLTDALPKMADAARNSQLRQAFVQHLDQTRTHAQRLEQILRELKCEPERESCPAMQGIIKEGSDMISAKGDDSTRDAGLIAAAQKAEHYEIASYGSVRNFAERLGFGDIARTLQMTLDEEGQTDKLLTQIAESGANQRAVQ